MDLQLKPTADACCVTHTAFQAGDRVVSFLVRDTATGEFVRADCLAAQESGATFAGEVLCRWTRTFKPVPVGANLERALKLSAESLFLTLTEDPDAPVEENSQLKQFLALMLERKRLVRARGTSAEGTRRVYEHGRTKRMIEVPAGLMDDAFFMQMRDKLGVLLGGTPGVGGGGEAGAAAQQAQQQQQ
jgi:hypothetical protein